MDDDAMKRSSIQWLKSRDIIADFLERVCYGYSRSDNEHNAAAIIARLAHAEPPLLICNPDEMKD
jgi:hypothetical protein